MEEVINKSDGQFKDMLDNIVDYKNKPLIKELSRPEQLSNNIKPAASLNSSTYSSAASSTSSSSSSTTSDSSIVPSSSSSSSTSSSLSTSSSTSSSISSSPSQSQVGPNNVQEYGKLEMAKMEDLGKTAKILEHRLGSPVSNAAKTSTTVTTSSTLCSSNTNSANLKQRLIRLNTPDEDVDPSQKYVTITAADGSVLKGSADISNLQQSSWKTIAKRDKRRKRPVEKTILAQEIPGNIGNCPVDELVYFIESGTNGTPNSGKNNKSKIQNINSATNNSNHLNIGSNNSNNNNSGTNNNVNSSSNNNSNTTSANNSVNVNNIIKKNESHPLNNKPQQMSSKMSNQAKNPPHSNHNQQQTVAYQTSQLPSKRQQPPRSQSDSSRDNQQPIKNMSKPLNQSQPIKQTPNVTTRNPQQQNQQRRSQQVQPSQQHPQQNHHHHQQQLQNQAKSAQPTQAAVTFAQHIRVLEEDVHHYTFGFFDEQPNQAQQTKLTNSLNNHNASNNSRKQISQPLQKEQKQKLKQSRASPNSEEISFKFNDNIDANSFNYEQILKFISNSWETEQARKQAAAAKSH